MILLQDGLDCLWTPLDKVIADPGHLGVEADLLKLALKHLVKLLIIHLWLLCLGFLFVDLHSAVIVMEFDVVFDDLLEANYHRFHFLIQFQAKVGFQVL